MWTLHVFFGGKHYTFHWASLDPISINLSYVAKPSKSSSLCLFYNWRLVIRSGATFSFLRWSRKGHPKNLLEGNAFGTPPICSCRFWERSMSQMNADGWAGWGESSGPHITVLLNIQMQIDPEGFIPFSHIHTSMYIVITSLLWIFFIVSHNNLVTAMLYI